MEETPKNHEENLAEEFRNLCRHLMETLRSAWDSQERKNLQQEIENGLDELASTLKQEFAQFQETSTGQEIKSELQDLHQRIQSGEAEETARREILNALRTINRELEKAAHRWNSGDESKSNP